MLTVEPLEPGFEAEADERAPALGQDVQKRVESIWKEEKVRRGRSLFNGKVFSVRTLEPGAAKGSLVDYKWFVAQRRDPELFESLGVRPLAVTGVLLCADGIVIGRRSTLVEQNVGEWELMPAGSVDASSIDASGRVDFFKAVIDELETEVGIAGSGDHVAYSILPFCITDCESHVVDVPILVKVSMVADDIMNAFAALNSKEHDALAILPRSGLVDGGAARMAPVSRIILEHIPPSAWRAEHVGGS